MKLTVNGREQDTAATTVGALLAELGMAGKPVAVEVNRQVVPRKAHAQTPLREGDQVELVTLVGGG